MVYKLYILLFILSNGTALKFPIFDEVKSLSKVLPRVPTFPEIAKKIGLKCEEYNVTTSDGYILRLFRIPGDVQRPVLLMHGILDSADGLILREKGSIAFHLAQKGYDLWIGNNRGNRYSRHHVSLDPNTDVKFWQFTFHEMGKIDLPAIIDFVLDHTGQTKLSALGHSEGNTIFYVMGSLKPKYNKKIKVLAALAPIAYLQHLRGLLTVAVEAAPALNAVLESINYQELLGSKSDVESLIRLICDVPVADYEICAKAVIFSVVGPDPAQLESEFLPTLVAHFPAGTSRKNVVHYSQLASRGKFAEYDYGADENMKIYGSCDPPTYNLTNVSFDVALYCGANDFLSTPEDVDTLKSQLPNVVLHKVLPYPQWNHIDHLYGKFMPKYSIPLISDLLGTYN